MRRQMRHWCDSASPSLRLPKDDRGLFALHSKAHIVKCDMITPWAYFAELHCSTAAVASAF